MHTQRCHELSDEQWTRIVALLNGIVWILRTGAPWRDLPEHYGKWQSFYSRLRRWQQAGVWDTILAALQMQAAHDDDMDGSLAFLDGSNVRAHQHAAGARKKGPPATRD